MGFLRRLLGGADPDATPTTPETAVPSAAASASDDDERAYELDLLRAEQERLDELRQRQLRYAEYAWQPPAQGGPRRADDEDAGRD
jgi:hypothetical protein